MREVNLLRWSPGGLPCPGAPSRQLKPLVRALKPRHQNRLLLALALSSPDTELDLGSQSLLVRALMPRLESRGLLELAQASCFEKRPPLVRAQASCSERRPLPVRALLPHPRSRQLLRRVPVSYFEKRPLAA